MRTIHHILMWQRFVLFKIGFRSYLLRNRYGERIIAFHGIDLSGENKYNSRFISKAYFEELMDYFSKNYNVLSLEDFYVGRFKKNTLNIALTFDDGQYNNYKFALPILKKHKFPATFFITSIHDKKNVLWPDFLDLVTFYTEKKEVVFEGNAYRKTGRNDFSHNGSTLKNRCKFLEYDQIEPIYALFEKEWNQIITGDFDVYWKLLNNNQIKEIAENPLFSIGAHGMTHANLEAITKENAEAEIRSNKTILEEITRTKINSFAFPFGTYTDDLVASCQQTGYSKILLLDYKTEKDKYNPMLKNRITINPYISKEQFLVCLLKGSYL
ncbi:polysaccharide deacetylase family protein [Flavobacterium sp.]|uniref:polysaccharide deacetylase family protein n=1 Tax=Flavobacterium sp. TaxID=239 RepID=UPI003D6A5C56